MSIQEPPLSPSEVSDLLLADAIANTLMTNMSSMFSIATGIPLYSSTWTPMPISVYAGTCIFLIVLAVTFCFIAFKSVLEERWIDAEFNRRYIVIIRKPNTKERISGDSDFKRALITRT